MTSTFSSVQSLSRVRLFKTPWIAAHHASLPITNSRSSLRLTSIKSVMPSSHLILCRPLLLLPPIAPSIRVLGLCKSCLSDVAQLVDYRSFFYIYRRILLCSVFFIVQLSHPYVTTVKTIALTRWTFVGKVMSLLFNIFSRLVITFLPRSKSLLISWLQSPSAVIFEPPKIKSDSFHCFPIYFPWSDGTSCHDLRFLNVEL